MNQLNSEIFGQLGQPSLEKTAAVVKAVVAAAAAAVAVAASEGAQSVAAVVQFGIIVVGSNPLSFGAIVEMKLIAAVEAFAASAVADDRKGN